MKKVLIIGCMLIIIVLSGCGQRFNKDVELSPNNFNEYFDLDFEFTEENEKVYLLVNLSPRFDLSIDNINLNVSFYYYYLLNKNDLVFLSGFEVIDFENPDDDSYQQKLEIGKANKLNNIKPNNYNINKCAGEISTFKTPKYKTKGFVTNKRENRKMLAEMIESLSEFETFYNANYIDLNMTVSAKKLYRGDKGELGTENNSTKLRSDPFYFETDTALGKSLIKQENDEYFSYTFGDDNYVSKEPIPMEDVNNNIEISDLLEFADIDISFEFNSDKMLIEKHNERYLISGFYKDFLNNEQYEIMVDI